MAEGLVEAGGKVHCLDILPEPDSAFAQARDRIKEEYGGGLEYHRVDVTSTKALNEVVASIAADKQRLDGLIAGMSELESRESGFVADCTKLPQSSKLLQP